MRVVVGYGNELRGEDAFGVDVIKELEKFHLKNTKLISAFQLTPEIVLELLEADEIIFIDACNNEKNHYALACSLSVQSRFNLSHHISPKTIVYMLESLYEKHPNFFIYSMMTKSFDNIKNENIYKMRIEQIVHHISSAQ
jgi:hydrogenase maturation protease